MKVEDKNGLILDFKMPATIYDPIVVTQCSKDRTPERIGIVNQVFNEKGDEVVYYAIGEEVGYLCEPTSDWQSIEEHFQQHAKTINRNYAERFMQRMKERAKEIATIREEKTQGINNELKFNR